METSQGTTTSEVVVPARKLEEFAARVFTALGMSAADAALMAEQITWAHVHGHSWLGARKVIQYGTRIKSGVTAASGEPEVVVDGGSFALLDAHDTFSMIAGHHAMNRTIERARTTGAAVTVVRNTTSAGALGYFAEMAVAARMIGVAINNGPPLMPPWGGTTKLIGNQAFAMASPAGKHDPIILDTALSEVTLVGIHGAQERGEPLQEGWALDNAGVPTLDPETALKGMLLPMGDHRGYGLAIMWEVLTGVLSGADRFMSDVTMPDIFDRPQAVSMFLLAVDPEISMAYEQFVARVDELIDQIHASPPAPGVDRVFVPGERSAALARERERDGIPIDAALITKLTDFAAELGVAWD